MIIKVNRERVEEVIGAMGAHEASLPIFAGKTAVLPLKLLEVRTPAVNIIKQEMLAAGGDAVTPMGAVNCADKFMDILLLGTRRQYARLAGKLAQMPYFGLEKVLAELRQVLAAEAPKTLLADGRVLTYDKVRIMGILNITPDSFYAGSRVADEEAVVARAAQMLEDGADILDIGGMSTRPGSDSITPQEERRRVMPIIYRLRKEFPKAVLSIDTYNSGTADIATAAGVDIINDISAMEIDKRMPLIAMQSKAPVILMHMRGNPKTMQKNTAYKDVVQEVAVYLRQRAELLHERGLGADKVIIDPGIGFAKNVRQNLLLMRDLETLTSFGYPVLLAASRKSSIGAVLDDLPAEERLYGTIATSLQAVYAGAQIIRVHDVKENVQAVRMLEAILHPERAEEL